MDPDVRGYLDVLTDRLRELSAEVRTSAEETRRHVEAAVRAGDEETRRYVEATVRAGDEDTRRYVDASGEETRRHFDVVAESLRAEIRTLGEGVVANSERIERVGAELRRDMTADARLVHAAIREVRTALAAPRRRRR
jgi:hypothetical protein